MNTIWRAVSGAALLVFFLAGCTFVYAPSEPSIVVQQENSGLRFVVCGDIEDAEVVVDTRDLSKAAEWVTVWDEDSVSISPETVFSVPQTDAAEFLSPGSQLRIVVSTPAPEGRAPLAKAQFYVLSQGLPDQAWQAVDGSEQLDACQG